MKMRKQLLNKYEKDLYGKLFNRKSRRIDSYKLLSI